MTYLYIAVGAVAGAPLRYWVQGRVQDALPGSLFPWGTLVVNVSGCLLIGLVLTLAEEKDVLSREARLLLVTGFLGGYTTFSTFDLRDDLHGPLLGGTSYGAARERCLQQRRQRHTRAQASPYGGYKMMHTGPALQSA